MASMKKINPDDPKYAASNMQIEPKTHVWRNKITADDIKELRQHILERAVAVDGDKRSAVALSGGVDSATVLFALMELGRSPKCYTFYVEGYKSPDLQSARQLTKAFGLDLIEVEIPSDPDSIYRDIYSVLQYAEMPKKTIIQCLIPWKYMLPKMEAPRVLAGLGQDAHYGINRRTATKLHTCGERAALCLRGSDFNHSLLYTDGNTFRYAKMAFGKEVVPFYECPHIDYFFLQFGLEALQKPYEKWVTVEAFKDYYKKGNFYRKHLSYQFSGVRQSHDALLKSKYNTMNAKNVVAIYNDIASKVESKV